MRFRLTICFVAIIGIVKAQQQMGSYMAYGPEVKFLSNLNYKVFESSNGYLWFGTLNGLVRFDGKRYKSYFSNYADANSLSDNVIFDIAEDKNNDLWFAGFYNGVTRYNQRSGKFKKYSKPTKDNGTFYGINAICNDRQNELWLATSGRGLAWYNFKTDSFLLYYPEPDKCTDGSIRGFNHITDIEQDKTNDNILWVGSFRGLYAFNKKTKTFTRYPSGLGGNKEADILICNIAQDNNQQIWLGTWNYGLQCFDKKTNTYLPQKASNAVSIVYDLTQISDSIIYAACLNDGLYKLNVNSNRFTNVTPPRNSADSSSRPGIQKVSVTKNAGIFIGGNHYVFQQHPDFVRLSDKVTFPDAKRGVDNFVADCVWDASRQCYWIATTTDAGIYSVDKSLQQTTPIGYERNPSQTNTYVRNVCVDKLNRVWGLSYHHGLFKYDEQKNKFTKQDELIPLEKTTVANIKRIKQNQSGDLWLLADSSLIFWDISNNSTTNFPIQWNKNYAGQHSLSGCELVVDPDGDAWLFTTGGMFHCIRKEKKIDHIFKTGTTENDLASTTILTGAFNKYRDLWLSSGNGIQVFDWKKYEILANHNIDGSLPSMSINHIATDSSGRIWAGTAAGIGLFDPTKKIWQLFNRMDGLSYDYLDGYLGITSNDQLVIDQINGFFIKDAQDMISQVAPPLLHITSLNINGESYSDSLLPEYITTLDLPYDKNNIDIEFAAMDWRYPLKTSYRYKIEGIPSLNSWATPNADCKINLTALAPGNYMLHLQALNGNGIWSKETILPIKIHPPFWKTWWFISICGITLIALVYSVYRYRIT